MNSPTTKNTPPRHEWHELKDASKTEPYCIVCVGDGWMSGEWDTCPHCFGTGREITEEQRRIYRCRKAERDSRESAIQLDKARELHDKNMVELAAAQEALLEAARAEDQANTPDQYGNTERDPFRYCSFPDCGCDGSRNCQAKEGANSGSLDLNYERGSFPSA